LGERYEIMNADIKRWAVGSPIQAPLDSLLELIRAQRIRPEEVERLVVRVAHLGANTTDNRHMPDICMQHLAAVMLADGSVSFKSSHDEKRMREAGSWSCALAWSSPATTRSPGRCRGGRASSN